MQVADHPPAGRRGRPPGTSARELELISLRMFTRDGFEDTTVERIAAAAGVSRRTFFRYFDSKADVLWHAFDGEVKALREAFAAVPPDVPIMTAIRQVVVGVNRYRAEDVPDQLGACAAGERRAPLRRLGACRQRLRRGAARPGRRLAVPAGHRPRNS